jgi:replicative DNA helicase
MHVGDHRHQPHRQVHIRQLHAHEDHRPMLLGHVQRDLAGDGRLARARRRRQQVQPRGQPQRHRVQVAQSRRDTRQPIPKEQLVTGKLSDGESQAVLAAIERLSRSRLHIVFGSGYTTSDVRAYALQVQATEGVKPSLIVVDYVQLLKDEEGDGRMRERNVSAAARGLKDVSGELGVPVLALVQLNRNRAMRRTSARS